MLGVGGTTVVTCTDGHGEAAGKSVVSFLLWFTMVTKWSYVMCSCSSFVSNRRPSRPAVGLSGSRGTFSFVKPAFLTALIDRQTDKKQKLLRIQLGSD